MDNKSNFEDKVCLVTGSGRGIGRAIALEFARRGADVIINYFRNPKPAEETQRQIEALGRKTILVKANVGELEEIEKLFQAIECTFGKLDFFINNAASGYNRPALQQRPKGWDWTLNINARAFLFCAQKAVPLMEKVGGGAMVAISSPGALRVLPDYVVVGASKAALEALVRYLAVELSPKNIVVNGVSPGVVETEALQHFDALRSDDQLIKKTIALTPAGRLVTPQDVANVVTFLCTPQASMIRGQIIAVDGGAALPGKLWGFSDHSAP
ncbi:MAG: enoyl-[acyl-carrier-protein] reductase FabL [Anaerolineales bacterium]